VYWGWRPLVFYVFISVLVTACGDQHNTSTATPTELPLLTLTLRMYASPSPTSTPVIPQIATSQAARNFDIESVVLQTYPPTCSLTSTDGLLCRGLLHNPSASPITRAAVLIELYRADGSLLATEIADVEQLVIPVGQSAPYHALFTVQEPYTRIMVSLYRAEIFDGALPLVEVETVSGGLVGGRYRVEARLYNPNEKRVENIRLVVTVYSDMDNIVGYRVMTIDHLDGGVWLPVVVEITPQMVTTDLTHTVYAEVWGTR
jgi:hypothetical protein